MLYPIRFNVADSDYYSLNIQTVEAQKAVDDALYAGSRAGVDATVEEAKALSPRKTGKNADSIAGRLRRTEKGLKGTIFTQSGYGGFIEIGERNVGPRPYIFPAAVHNLGLIPDEIRIRMKYTFKK